MTNSPMPKGPARADTEATTEKLSDAMQTGFSAAMTIPQKMMQANLEAITEGMNFMNRRMKAQAAMWSSVGQISDGSSLRDIQQQLITSMTTEMASEIRELSEMARKNIGLMTGAVTAAGEGFSPGRSS
jgi:Phasin protein